MQARVRGSLIAVALSLALFAQAQTSIGTRILKPNEIPPSESVRLADSKRVRGTMVGVLGWRLGVRADAFGQLSFKEAAAKVDAAGLAFVEGVSTQKLTPGIGKNLDYRLSTDEIRTVQYRLLELRLAMPAYRIDAVPEDDASRRKLFDVARQLGVETIITSSVPSALADLDKLANEFGVDVAIAGRDTKQVMGAISGRSKRIGVAADTGVWLEAGVKPSDGVAMVGDRLMAMNLRDRKDAALGSGTLALESLLNQVAKLEPPVVLQWPPTCTDCTSPLPNAKPIWFTVDSSAPLAESAEVFDRAVHPVVGRRVDEMSRHTPITETNLVPTDERRAIEAALPKQALATPKKPRKLLVLDLCIASFYHTTIAHVNLAVERMAVNTGAYQAVFSNDLDNLKYPKIKDYDAVFLNNLVGAVFSDPEVLDGLIRFVREGGGVMGFHGSSFASQDQRAYGELLGAQEGQHQYNGEPGVVKLDDPANPLTRQFRAPSFEWYDEYYHFAQTTPYSRDTLHVLMSVDAAKADMRRWHIRPDNDYGLVWVRKFGAGRVFNTALGHRPGFFANPDMARMILGAIQFVLGDLEVDTTPSSKPAGAK